MKRDTPSPKSAAVPEMRDLFGDGPNKAESLPENDLRIPGSVFFAIRPSGDAASVVLERAKALQREQGLKSKLLDPDRLHLTLAWIGDIPKLPQANIDVARRIASGITAKPFVVALDRALSFRGNKKRPLVLVGGDGVAGLRLFCEMLAKELKRVGCPVLKASQYEPHMTLLWDEIAVAEHVIEPVRWTVSDFVLIHSLQGRAQHVELGRWPLRG